MSRGEGSALRLTSLCFQSNLALKPKIYQVKHCSIYLTELPKHNKKKNVNVS